MLRNSSSEHAMWEWLEDQPQMEQSTFSGVMIAMGCTSVMSSNTNHHAGVANVKTPGFAVVGIATLAPDTRPSPFRITFGSMKNCLG